MAGVINEKLAVELADVARLLEEDDTRSVLTRLLKLAVEIVPGCDEAGITMVGPDGDHSVEVTDLAVQRCHDQQFACRRGPCVEVLRHREPRRIDDVLTDTRWPEFAATARAEGLRSCLSLPVCTQPVHPAAAVNFYARQPDVFTGHAHDIALLLAAQGGTALVNMELYQHARRLADNLQRALASRATIDQAKGVIMGQRRCTADQAFQILVDASQHNNVKLRDVAARVVRAVSRSAHGDSS